MFSFKTLACVVACWVGSNVAIAQEWTVASIAPKTGLQAATGNDLLAGAQLAFNAVNAKGGVAGRKIRLVSADNADLVPNTLEQARELLKKERPIAFVGGAGSAAMEALARDKAFLDAGIPLVGPKTGSVTVASGQSPIFLTRATYADEASAILRHCKVSGFKRLGVFHQDDAFGKEALAVVQKLAPDYGVEINVTASYSGVTADIHIPPDARKAVDAITAKSPQAILMIAPPAGAAAFVGALYSRNGQGAPLFALSTTDPRQFVASAGLIPARGVVIAQVVPAPRNEGLPIVRRLVADLRAAGAEVEDVNPSSSFLEGYIAAQVLIEGLRRAGAAADGGKLIQSLQSLKGFDLGGYALNFDASTRSGSRFVELAVINAQGEAIR